MEPLFIHEDIRKASTIASDFYTHPAYFEASKERIFARTWQWIGDTDLVALPGQLAPLTLLPGFLDEPALLVRDQQDVLHCMSNVCTHRGNLLIEHNCQASQIRCRYHGRRFKLDGSFVSMPEFEGVEGFPCAKDDLPQLAFGNWQQHLFAGITPCITLNEAIGEMQQRLHWLPLQEFRLMPELSRDYLVKAHWALYCENYLEGFHIPFVHQSLNSVLDFGAYTTEIYRYSNLQLGIAKGGEDVFDLPESSADFGKNVAAYYYWVFPNMMFNFYPWGLSINIVKPMATGLCKVSFLSYVWDENKLGLGAGADTDKVEREDEAVVENVQRGIRSRLYHSGRYSPTRELGTHHFHRLIAEFMAGG
jgi:choline monooxygenase